MPEAAVNEYNASVPREDEVRASRQRSVVDLEPQPGAMKIATNK